MLFGRSIKGGAAKSGGSGRRNSSANAAKELQKLKRQDLLELLLEQMRENDALRASLAMSGGQVDSQNELIEHLKATLARRDAQIDRLTEQLKDKDELIQNIYGSARTLVDTRGPRLRRELMDEVEDQMAAHYLRTAASKTNDAGEQDADDAAETTETAEATEAAEPVEPAEVDDVQGEPAELAPAEAEAPQNEPAAAPAEAGITSSEPVEAPAPDAEAPDPAGLEAAEYATEELEAAAQATPTSPEEVTP